MLYMMICVPSKNSLIVFNLHLDHWCKRGKNATYFIFSRIMVQWSYYQRSVSYMQKIDQDSSYIGDGSKAHLSWLCINISFQNKNTRKNTAVHGKPFLKTFTVWCQWLFTQNLLVFTMKTAGPSFEAKFVPWNLLLNKICQLARVNILWKK